MPYPFVPAARRPSWSIRTRFAGAGLILATAMVIFWAQSGGPSTVEASAAAGGPATDAMATDAAPPLEHPEWVLPFAASLGDFSAPASEGPAPSRAVALALGPARPPLPTWLTGQADLSPQAVVQTWQTYARTQGPSLDAMRELLAYARQHPARAVEPDGTSVDAWLQAAAAAGGPVLSQMVAAGYLDDRIALLFDSSDAEVIAYAVRDMDLASRCAGAACTSWRARYALAYMQERDERRDPSLRCNPPAASAGGSGWRLAEDDSASHDVALAMDGYLARHRAVTCTTHG